MSSKYVPHTLELEANVRMTVIQSCFFSNAKTLFLCLVYQVLPRWIAKQLIDEPTNTFSPLATAKSNYCDEQSDRFFVPSDKRDCKFVHFMNLAKIIWIDNFCSDIEWCNAINISNRFGMERKTVSDIRSNKLKMQSIGGIFTRQRCLKRFIAVTSLSTLIQSLSGD